MQFVKGFLYELIWQRQINMWWCASQGYLDNTSFFQFVQRSEQIGRVERYILISARGCAASLIEFLKECVNVFFTQAPFVAFRVDYVNLPPVTKYCEGCPSGLRNEIRLIAKFAYKQVMQ